MNNFKIAENGEMTFVSSKSGIRYMLCSLSVMMKNGSDAIPYVSIINTHILDDCFCEAADSAFASLIDLPDVIGTTYCEMDDIESYSDDISDIIDAYEAKQIENGSLYALNNEGCVSIA